MFSVATLKLLLLVALSLGSPDASTIQITSGNTNYICTHKVHGWTLVETGDPTPDLPDKLLLGTPNLKNCGPDNAAILRVLMHHDWSHDSVLLLDNGDRVEKRGTTIFYTFRPGAANEKVYTLTSKS
jgi:hypothetical protein